MSDKSESIEVCGVRFSADEVKSVVIKRDGREISLSEKEDEPKSIGFRNGKE